MKEVKTWSRVTDNLVVGYTYFLTMQEQTVVGGRSRPSRWENSHALLTIPVIRR
jgi:hypothetical protein